MLFEHLLIYYKLKSNSKKTVSKISNKFHLVPRFLENF